MKLLDFEKNLDKKYLIRKNIAHIQMVYVRPEGHNGIRIQVCVDNPNYEIVWRYETLLVSVSENDEVKYVIRPHFFPLVPEPAFWIHSVAFSGGEEKTSVAEIEKLEDLTKKGDKLQVMHLLPHQIESCA